MTSLPPADACAGCAARDVVIAEQAAAVGDLQARVERLISRNSGNSSMPPSADDLPGRRPPEGRPARKAGKRNPGKQPGAPGSHLAWCEEPDDTVPHLPDGTCECGSALSGAADLGVTASHQQTEIPLASARVIQHDLHAVACGCGKVHQAPGLMASAPAGCPTARTCRHCACSSWSPTRSRCTGALS